MPYRDSATVLVVGASPAVVVQLVAAGWRVVRVEACGVVLRRG